MNKTAAETNNEKILLYLPISNPHLHSNLEFRFGFLFCNSIEERKKVQKNTMNNKQNMEN